MKSSSYTVFLQISAYASNYSYSTAGGHIRIHFFVENKCLLFKKIFLIFHAMIDNHWGFLPRTRLLLEQLQTHSWKTKPCAKRHWNRLTCQLLLKVFTLHIFTFQVHILYMHTICWRLYQIPNITDHTGRHWNRLTCQLFLKVYTSTLHFRCTSYNICIPFADDITRYQPLQTRVWKALK